MCAGLLLRAFVETDGDVVLLRANETPLIFGPRGRVEISARRLTEEAIVGLLDHFTPESGRRLLFSAGYLRHIWPAIAGFPGERFYVTANTGTGPLRLVIRRLRSRERARGAPPASPVARVTPITPRNDDESLAVPSATELWPDGRFVSQERNPTVVWPTSKPVQAHGD